MPPQYSHAQHKHNGSHLTHPYNTTQSLHRPAIKKSKKKNATPTNIPGLEKGLKELCAQIEEMKRNGDTGTTSLSSSSTPSLHNVAINSHESSTHSRKFTSSHSKAGIPDSGSSSTEWEKKSQSLCDNWETLLPSLQEPLLLYYRNSIGHTVVPSGDIPCYCDNVSCKHHIEKIWCFYYDRECPISILSDLSESYAGLRLPMFASVCL